ncbi:MAG: tetratricopeptide repeat protein, partial [Treponema sp.]|nr:tetratricopeptide repeat protein [Treponema sp.]
RMLESVKGSGDGTEERLSYEVQLVERYNLFIWVGLILLVCSYIFGELNLTEKKKSFFALLGLQALCFTFTSCSGGFSDRMRLLNGSLEWNRKEYQDATADFMTVIESAEARGDDGTVMYAVFDLATTYLMQGEDGAAAARFEELAGDLPDNLRFALLYNLGILAHRNGNYPAAADFFKEALLIDGGSVDAKVNLELSLVGGEGRRAGGEMQPVMESGHEGTLESAIYSIIREQEEGQWKNMRKEEPSGDAQDY